MSIDDCQLLYFNERVEFKGDSNRVDQSQASGFEGCSQL